MVALAIAVKLFSAARRVDVTMAEVTLTSGLKLAVTLTTILPCLHDSQQ